MKLTADSDGNRVSIPVDGIKDFDWCPDKNIIVHTSFPEGQNI
jgi:hypothetical protein